MSALGVAVQIAMPAPAHSPPRVSVDGKFFRLGGKKFYVKGVTYGTFAPNEQGEQFPSPAQAAADFRLIVELGGNLLRVYTVPPRWLLDLAQAHGLKVLVDVPWNKHLCFLDSPGGRAEIFATVRKAATACAGHPAVFALSVVNEIPPDVVRWSGALAMAEFIDDLVDAVKEIDAELLCTFANFPPTEFLRSRNVDFLTFNVYLHYQKPFENYLARLQMIADAKPLLLGEFGIDSIREGEAAKGKILEWQIETAFRGGAAGTIVFSFTDDWFRGGKAIEDWAFGLTTRARQPKESFQVVRRMFGAAPYFPLPHYPMVSVVVASYNGGRTLPACLKSLARLNYPSYEVILVDDGSTDDTPAIAAEFRMELEDRRPPAAAQSLSDVAVHSHPNPLPLGEGRGEGERGVSSSTARAPRPRMRVIRQVNFGLSVARNTGIHAARGEVVAFTDSDCRADEDWLYYLMGDLLNSEFAGIGGHNFLPPEDGWIPAAVMVSPGGPAHVMLTDRLAEHIPGCNMAFYKWALDEIGGFDPIFRSAGDDVDVCWRLQQHGHKIGFSPAGFVWHYRRSTARAYVKQQRGYGAAEAMLVRKHPEYFNFFGASIWHGRIYTAAKIGVTLRQPMIYHGTFASGFFQSIYSPPPSVALMLLTSLEYHVLVTLPLLVLGLAFLGVKVPLLLPLGVTSLGISLALCVAAAAQADLPKKKRRCWSRPLVALLFLLQPIVRGWARYAERLSLRQTPLAAHETLATLTLKKSRASFGELQYWSGSGTERLQFLTRIIEQLDQQGWQSKTDTGWNHFDVEIFGSRWCRLQLTTVAEAHHGGQQLFRCRLATSWSLLAHVAFWSAFLFECLLIGALGESLWWLSFLLLSLPALAWLFRQEQRNLQRILAAFLDDVAKQLQLAKIETSPAAGAAKRAQ